QESEYSIVGTNRGDQVFSALSISTNKGYIVWQDNYTDGSGLGISARQLNSTLSGQFGVFRVNQQGTNDQMRPRVAMFSNGGAVFVWEGNQTGNKDIYASFVSSNGTFLTGDVRVNVYTNSEQTEAAVCRLNDDRALIVWTSLDQDGSYQGVYGRIFNSSGQPSSGEFLINQTTSFGQRSPSVTCLPNGNVVAVWISELQRNENSVDVFGRIFDENGQPLGNEFLINTGTNICANPEVCATADSGFVVVWGEKAVVVRDPPPDLQVNGWDVFFRVFTPSLKGIGQATRINQFVYGDQFAPRISGIGNQLFIVWSSLGQDGSAEGVFGRFIDYNGQFLSDEFKINTTTISSQIYPVVASDGVSRFLVAWSSFTGVDYGMELNAQRYATVASPLPAPSAPIVSALNQSRLMVSWPDISGFNISGYGLYIDGSTNPVFVSVNYYTLTGLAPSSVHTFAIDYVLSDGRRSQISAVSIGKTYGEDLNMDGLPDDWQKQYWGTNPAMFPPPNIDSDGDGASNLEEFLQGTNPVDPRSVLKAKVIITSQGRFIHWNTQPGFIYQVQVSTNFTSGWSNLGQQRFAPNYEDSMLIESTNDKAFYRVIRIR
ncbi:MAG TPA: fibronectin type III domain-containing protein, partial [Verrucomicrobiota bacterium]|nr:fibronectin type III domain-containing protein [Verrucomicrobiota bacterium]